MSKPTLTQEIAYPIIQEFFSKKLFVFFATGTSCAVDLGFSMWSLESWLKEQIPLLDLSDAQQLEWEGVLEALDASGDFESAMNSIEDNQLLGLVISKTAEHVANVDQSNSFPILNGTTTWPAIRLLKRLVNALPETAPTLHVGTPNYDLLAEYAFTQAGVPYTTGFWGGVLRHLDWVQSERQMTYSAEVMVGKKLQRITRYIKHIKLYKVHGSLNTFIHQNQVVETDIWKEAPSGVERLMITPGASKYERLHDYRDALLGEYDKAIKLHDAFLFLGFGFNDSQLVNSSITEKLKVKRSPALIITRDSNPRIEALVQESENAWLICKAECDESTRIYNSQYAAWLNIPDKSLWKFDEFVTEIVGG